MFTKVMQIAANNDYFSILGKDHYFHLHAAREVIKFCASNRGKTETIPELFILDEFITSDGHQITKIYNKYLVNIKILVYFYLFVDIYNM